MGEDPDMIRSEIERTRERLGDTVEQLGDKADVKGRAVDRAREMRDRVAGAGHRVTEAVAGSAHAVDDATPNRADVRHGARRAAGIAQENPLGLALGGLAVGVLAGMALPSTGRAGAHRSRRRPGPRRRPGGGVPRGARRDGGGDERGAGRDRRREGDGARRGLLPGRGAAGVRA